MAPDIRTGNLHLARHICDGLGNLVAKLGSVTNETALVKMGQGKKAISDAMAETIEKELELPRGWMDRDNEVLIAISPIDHVLCREVLMLNDEAKKSLVSFLSSLRN